MSREEIEVARLTALFVDDLLGSLDAQEAAELRALRARHPDFDDGSVEAAVAALQVATAPVRDPLPAPLFARIAVDAADFFAGTPPGDGQGTTVRAPVEVPTVHRARAPQWPLWGGGLAAGVIVAAVVILGDLHNHAVRLAGVPDGHGLTEAPPQIENPAPPAGEPADAGATDRGGPEVTRVPPEVVTAIDPAAERKAFLATHRWVVQRSWQPGNDPTGLQVRGDVVWDPRSQTGFLRFVGLRRNNPMVEQYQLWIFDGRRDQKFPVDGGVFDAAPNDSGEVVIPIRSKLHVDVALVFAVTVERPGGVVVSDRARLAAIANVS